MHFIDWILIFVLIAFLAAGIFRGPVKELISLGALCLGIAAAGRFGPSVSDWVAGWLPFDLSFLPLSAYLVFLATYGAASLLGYLLRPNPRRRDATWTHHLWGGLIGGCRGVVCIAVVLVVLPVSMPFDAGVIQKSVFFKPTQKIYALLSSPEISDSVLFPEKFSTEPSPEARSD